ncbi:MAG: hypothetical protein MNPFHGCM_03152 [Gemmatimonadaceae bacterium]|nr:hypothetical protein [Gemmatimonadaceae bacterium]
MRGIPAWFVMSVVLSACGARTVSVESAPAATVAVTLTVTNALPQALNIYVVTGSSDRFLQQVAANSTTSLPVAGVATGSVVQLKAVTADGAKTYTKAGVALQATNAWQVP